MGKLRQKLPLINCIKHNLSYKLMTSEILRVKLTKVYYSAVWIGTLFTPAKYLVTCQFLCLIYTASNFKMYVLR